MITDHREPLNAGVLLACVALFLLSIPAFIPKPVQFIAFVVAGWYSCRIICTQTTGDFSKDFGVGPGVLFQYLVFLDFALLTPPEDLKDFDNKDPTSVTKRPFKQRVLWLLKLLSNPRGIGWAHEPSHLPPRPSHATPRSTFVISRILHAAFGLGIAGGVHLVSNSAGMFMGDKLLTGAPLLHRVPGVLCFGLGGIGGISGINALFAAGTVGCGFSSPDRWPPLFGSPLQAWSIRRFWRRFWHQMIRRSVLSCTSSLLGCVLPAKYLGTRRYKLAQLYVVFCISGLAHAGGDVMASGKWGFRSLTFFMLQPFGITIEIVVSYLWNRLRSDIPDLKKPIADEVAQKHSGSLSEDSIPPLWIRCVGFIWVAIWMVWTASFMADGLNFARLSADPQSRISSFGE